ncbi:hypothetical protein HOY80DRAFT_535786 [Tuber brumale]|nr:hypothetical protein HOY80DRAFT_535786 [Tuber brumale]
MATKVVRCIKSFSRTSLSPTATLQGGLTAQRRRRFISSSGKDGEVAVGVNVENRRIDASDFMNKTGPKPAELSVGNGLTADVMMSPSIGTLKQTTIMQMEEIGKLYRKQGVFFHTNGAQALGKIPVEVGKWNFDWMSISGTKAYGPKRTGTYYIRCGLKAMINPLMSGRGQEHGLRSGTLSHSFLISFGEARRIVQQGIEYTCTSQPFFSLNSICSSTVRDSYIYKIYRNKQPKQLTRTFRMMSYNRADTRKGKRNAITKDSGVGIWETSSTEVQNTEADKNTRKKWRNPKQATSYSEITVHEAEDLLGLRLNLPGTPLKQMLEGKSGLLGPDAILKLKRKIYQDLVDYVEIGGYPTEANPNFEEANIKDLVIFAMYPVMAQFKRETGRKLYSAREKEITSIDSSTSGMQEFVLMDYISYDRMKYVLIVEAKKVSLEEARKQCFLSLKDMRDCNGGGTVYGFVIMGDSWRMISFDGEFKMSEKIELLFETMDEQEERWMADYSILVECLNVALSNGGKDPVEVV